MRRLTMITALLAIALPPMLAAVSPEAAPSARDAAAPSARDSSVSVAIAQPLAAMDGAPLVTMRRRATSNPMLPESGMLVLVGSSLLGLAALVRRST
jgi:hypothetical protein